nr:DUF4091 domain-containing protein [uncultured Desulfobacter sp.]
MKAFRYMKFFLSFIVISANVWAQDPNQENYIYKLSQSTDRYTFWTTLPSERVFKDDVVPSDTGSGILVYAARNESEPFQLVVNPSVSGNITVNVGEFGPGIEIQLYQVKYVTIAQATDSLGRTGDYPDPLWPLETGASVSVTAGENTAFWFDVHVPETTPAGDYTTHVEIGGIDIPVTLHIFNFSIPETLHPKSQMNVSHQAFLTQYGVSCCGTEYWLYVDKIKQYFIDHRLTPKSVLWSGGLTSSGAGPYIDYDCAGTLTDTDGIWGFEAPAERYIDADGLMQDKFPQSFNNGTGFPSFMAATFSNNDASADQRPATFCGQTRSAADWYTANDPSTTYNEKWFQYITAIQDYLASTGYLDKAYYYFANEPQDQADYDAVAWYSRYLKAAAPDFKLMVSEEPKPEIYEHSDYVQDGQVDIWLPVLNNYDPTISHDRKKNHGEETWIYFLHGTRPPFFNPITLDHPGIESKLTGWFLWKYRIGGIAYYSLNNWSQNPWTDPMNSDHNGDLFMLYPPSPEGTSIAYGSNNHRFVPSIRFELMRDSLEDYEYFHVMNGNSGPQVYEVNAPDAQVDKIIKGVASYTRDSGFMYNLRRLIGLYNGGEIAEIPDITPPMAHPRAVGVPGNYYINFQDPNGLPATTYTEDTYDNGYTCRYLTYANHDYLQVGAQEYDQIAGFGWLDDTEHFLTGRDPWGTEQDERKITCVYDDYAHHPSVFEFDLPNGTYRVEASVGTPRKVRTHNRLVIEGVTFVDDEASEYYIVRSRDVTVSDGKLTLDIGIWDYYTMINYLDIETIYSLSDLDCSGQVDQADLELFAGVFGSACESGAYCMGDFDGDADVDSTDLSAFVTDFSNPE